MPLSPLLETQLRRLAVRQRRWLLWCKLGTAWASAALLAFLLTALQRETGWSSALSLPLVAVLGLGAAVILFSRRETAEPDWRALAQQIEERHLELDGRLLTAVQQHPQAEAELNYLQIRLLHEVLRHNQTVDWAQAVPASRLRLAQAAHWLALFLFLLSLAGLRTSSAPGLLTNNFVSGITVTPGDVSLEHGAPLVVLARFKGPLPATAELVLPSAGAADRRIPLVKSLADPMFGGSVPEVLTNFAYHVQYGSERTRDFKVAVFEYPRLERADIDLTFPKYTQQADQHIQNTRRVSAVEGTRLALTLRLNKPVASARLEETEKGQDIIPLRLETNQPAASLGPIPLTATKTYELRLVDADGRTNKTDARFVFEVYSNHPPEIRLASPRGDVRPSPLEELSFEGTVWDDFGVRAYGLAYARAGDAPQFIELGRNVPGKEKRSFKHLLRLEDLGLQPDEVVSWFVWADDLSADAQIRHTTGDLFFAEVRPFEEIFREGEGMNGQSQAAGSGGEAGEQEGQTGKLAELQKQIINATWKLQREQGIMPADSKHSPPARDPATPAPRNPQSRTSVPGTGPQRATLGRGHAPLGHTGRKPTAAFRLFAAVAVPDDEPEDAVPPLPPSAPSRRAAGQALKYEDDAGVVRDSQAQALEQAESAQARQQDARAAALWSAATKQMQQALDRLNQATNSPAALAEALSAEQSAYQALLRLQEHEYQVARTRNRNQRGSSRNQQMQRQLQQMDLAQSEDRYENQREAQAPQPSQRREQLQVMNRLQELARRQQDLNERLQELQTALQEARTEQERAEIQRRLKRLEEEEQQMLSDVDELRQRMDRPENQSRLADERRQLEQTREEVQRAAQSAGQGQASPALAAGTRAQRQLQQLRDQLRKENSSQFAEDLRELRNQARELARQQEELSSKMTTEAGNDRRSLSDSPEHNAMLEQLSRQKQRVTNLVDHATQLSQQAEQAEPLLSRQLYDSVRKFTQDSAKNFNDTQDDLLKRGLMAPSLYDRLKESPDTEAAKLLELTSAMRRQNFLQPAAETAQQSQRGMDELMRGVERAAESVLGDDTEALRLARQELDQLTKQLQNEITRNSANGSATNGQSLTDGQGRSRDTNRLASAAGAPRPGGDANPVAAPRRGGERDDSRLDPSRAGAGENARSPGSQTQRSSSESAAAPTAGQANDGNDSNGPQPTDQATAGGRQGGDSQSRPAQAGGNGRQQGNRARSGQAAEAGESASASADGETDSASSRRLTWDWNSASGGGGGGGVPNGPITGGDFLNWSDRLREVEEMIEQPDLRNEVAAAREHARALRQELRRDRKKPDWAVVRSQVMKPLIEVRDRIADELARRESKEALVPIDRDPVPGRYSELVRKYYEGLGKDK